MAGQSEPECKLKPAVQKQMDKLKKLHGRMRMWSAAATLCAVIAAIPPVLYLLTGNMPTLSFEGSLFLSADWAVVIGVLGVGLLGATLFQQQYRREKDKFDKLRAAAVEKMRADAPVCECKWYPCSCKDKLMKEMSDLFDINLYY